MPKPIRSILEIKDKILNKIPTEFLSQRLPKKYQTEKSRTQNHSKSPISNPEIFLSTHTIYPKKSPPKLLRESTQMERTKIFTYP